MSGRFIPDGYAAVEGVVNPVFVPTQTTKWTQAIEYMEFLRAVHVTWRDFALAHPGDSRLVISGSAVEHQNDIDQCDNILARLRGIDCPFCRHDHYTPGFCDHFLRNDGSEDDPLCRCNVTDLPQDVDGNTGGKGDRLTV